MLPVLRVMSGLRGLRGTAFDPFGYTHERRTERQLIADYEASVAELVAGLTPDNHEAAVTVATIPEEIRGFGPVKEASITRARLKWTLSLEQFRAPRRMPRFLMKVEEATA